MYDMTCISSHYAVRQSPNANNLHIHRFDLTDLITATTNPWRVSKLDGWRDYLVDCKINWDLPLGYYRVDGNDVFYPDCQVEAVNSFQGRVLDVNSVEMAEVCVGIFDKYRRPVSKLESNEDAYIGANLGVTTNSSKHLIQSNSFDLDNKRYKEVLFTSGEAEGHRSVIYKSNSGTEMELAEPAVNQFAIGDRFIEIPYVTYRIQKVHQDGADGYGNEPIEDMGAFPVRYRKFGYKFNELNKAYSSPVVDSVVLFVNPDVTMTEAQVEGFTGINFNHHTIPVQEYGELFSITLDCNNYTLDETYNFLEWRLSQNSDFYGKYAMSWHNPLVRELLHRYL